MEWKRALTVGKAAVLVPTSYSIFLQIYINGALVHYHGRTERLVLQSTAAAEHVAVSRLNTACRFIRDILKFWGNTHNTYYIVHATDLK
jgi:hypothetical protein